MSKNCFRGEDTEGEKDEILAFCLWLNWAGKDVI